jgi:hypothetical protein
MCQSDNVDIVDPVATTLAARPPDTSRQVAA